MLENPKAMNTTTQPETAIVTVKKDVDIAMGDQQPSVCDMTRVQRLSRSSEYTQAGGSAGQPTVHACKDCGTTDLANFGIRRDHNRPWNYCRKCRQERNRATQKAYGARPEVKAKKQELDRKYAQRTSADRAAYKAAWTEQNKERLAANKRQKYEENRLEILQKSAEYKKANAGVVNARCARRHAGKMQRMPKWLTDLDKFVIQETYDKAQLMTKLTGIPHEVDHIIPLQGKLVSGLHVPWNLQVIPKAVNASKQNKVEDIVSSGLKEPVLSFVQRRTANV